jgi:uncharacterized protein YdeI (YjbR/CyaY-like superfamily)
MTSAKPVRKTFQALLEKSTNNLGWTIIRVPLDVAKTWGVRGQLKVKGEINGFPFQTSLFPSGRGYHTLLVNKKMQRGANARVGAKARFRLEPDLAQRSVTPPKEWLQVLSESKRLRKYYESLSYSRRREIARNIAECKQADTRRRRAQQLAEHLMQAMEAERELPPLIERALALNPLARQGWQLMPPGHRRSHLLGIFYYRNPESRARRLEKALQEMVTYAEKTSRRSERSLPD